MTLADRIKCYEKTFSFQTVRRMPVMIRVDGKCFHSFTKGCAKPFDKGIISSMVSSAIDVAKEMQGCKAVYIQSDEATFCLTDYDTLEMQGWFDYDLPKMVSISAARMSVAFNYHFLNHPQYSDTFDSHKMQVFDSRAFSIPPDDVVNAFLWRAQDWERNSLQMYARVFFSHKELMNKGREEMHEMLHGIGKNWAMDLTDQERNGTFLIHTDDGIKTRADILPTYQAINEAIGHLFVAGG